MVTPSLHASNVFPSSSQGIPPRSLRGEQAAMQAVFVAARKGYVKSLEFYNGFKVRKICLTHSLTIGPPDLRCKTVMISFPLTNGFKSHTFSRPASQHLLNFRTSKAGLHYRCKFGKHQQNIYILENMGGYFCL